MTLEEKIAQNLGIELVARFSHKTFGRNGGLNNQFKDKFIDGAYWMRDELLPVMKEMKEALIHITHNGLVWTDISENPKSLLAERVKEAKAAIEKYNALFEDKQKQS